MELVRRGLSARKDPREVAADPHALPLRGAKREHTRFWRCRATRRDAFRNLAQLAHRLNYECESAATNLVKENPMNNITKSLGVGRSEEEANMSLGIASHPGRPGTGR